MAYRPGIRVPVYFRRTLALTVPDPASYDLIPEAVAGSLEPRDRGVDGFLARVVAEVWEEAGFSVDPGPGGGLWGAASSPPTASPRRRSTSAPSGSTRTNRRSRRRATAR